MLEESRRRQLDGIVQQMINNKESDSNVQLVVNDFTQKYNQSGFKPAGLDSGKLGTVASFTGGKELAIGLAKGLGGEANQLSQSAGQMSQDTNALVQRAKSLPSGDPRRKQLLQSALGQAQVLSNQASQQLAELPTSGQVLGSAGKLGLTIGTLGGAGTGGSLGSQVLKGAGLGAGFGVSQGLEEGKTGKELISPTLVGGAVGAAVPLIAEGIKQGFNKLFPKISRSLEESNLRLTPTQKTNLKNKLGDVDEFMSKQKIVGTPEHRYEVVNKIYNNTEDDLQNYLKKEVSDRTIAKDVLIKKLGAVKRQFANERDVNIIRKQVDDLISIVDENYPRDIPLWKLNQLKRSTFDNAFNKAGDKVLDEVEFAMGDVLKESVEKGAKGITGERLIRGVSLDKFNKMYGTIINTRKLLKGAIGKNQLGIFGRFVAGLFGGSLGALTGGGPIGSVLGFGLGEEGARQLATPVKSGLAAGFKTLSEKAQKPLVKGIGETAKRLVLPTIFRE